MHKNKLHYLKDRMLALISRTDTTETKEKITLAKEQAETAKFALDQHSLVSIADIDGNILYVNDKFVDISGYQESELIGRKHSVLNSNKQPKSYWLAMHQTVLAGKVWHDEVRNRAKNGDYYWVDTTIAPNFDSNK
jgi:two-component system sensor histidine kinase/response regulator